MGYHTTQMEKGIFFIDLLSYKTYFKDTNVSYDTSGWSVARFLKLNDTKGPMSSDGKK